MMNGRLLAGAALASLLIGCGGGGGEGSTPPVVAPGPQLSLLGPDYGDALLATECGFATGSARQARYPLESSAIFSGTLRSPIAMRSDGAGGLIVAQDESAQPNVPPVGSMYRIDGAGTKTALNMPYSRVFDVGPDGAIWYAQSNATANAPFGMRSPSGADTVLALQQGYTGAPSDGVVGTVPLGLVSLIAAGRDRTYVLVAGEANSHDNAYLRGPLPAPSHFSLRLLTRGATGAAVVVSTLATPVEIGDAYYIRGMRTDANDNLVVLVNAPFKQLVGVSADGINTSYIGEASVWRLTTTGAWTKIAAKTYPVNHFVAQSNGSLFGRDVDDLSLAPDGTIWVGGGTFGAIDNISVDGTWTTIAQLDGHAEEQIGAEGNIAQATFRFAYQPVAQSDGVLFYDSNTCQIRKLAATQLSTFSGPVFTPLPTLARKQLLGIDAQNRLLFAKPGDKWLAAFDLATGAITTLDNHGIVTQKPEDLGCVSSQGIGGSESIPCAYQYVDSTVALARSWWGMNGSAPIFSLTTFKTLAPNMVLYEWQSASASRAISAAVNWPGVLIGDAISSQAGGFHVIGGKAFLFGTVRTDPPVQFPVIYVEERLYQVDLASGQALPLAGKTIPSASFNQQLIELGNVATIGSKPVFVQKRKDGGYWLANAKEIWQLDATGATRRVAGLRTTGAAGIDGTGDAVSFAFISQIRVLPDDTLLVADRDAHAIRLVDNQGHTSTLVGRLNQAGLVVGPLPAGLLSPVDVIVNGKDLLISTDKLPNLIRVQGVL